MAFGQMHQLGEDPAALDQLGVGADLGDPALVEDEDAVGLAQGGQTVSDQDDGAVGAGGVDGILHPSLTLVIQRGGPLVEDQDRRVLEEDPGQGNPLSLASGEVLAPLGHRSLVSARHLHDLLMDARQLRGMSD